MGRIRHSWRAAGLWFALIALALRLAAPAGFMLAPDDHNRLTVTLCSGAEMRTAEIDLATGKVSTKQAPSPGHDDKGKADSPCSFAVAAVAAIEPHAVSLAAPLAQAFAVPRIPLDERPSLQPAGPPLPARGPPLHA